MSRDVQIPVVDIFAGAGGLGEGFSCYPDRGRSCFDVRLSIEKDQAANQTLQLRKFFNQFPPDEVPDEYYRFLQSNGEETLESLVQAHGRQWDDASRRVLTLELGRNHTDETILDGAIESAIGMSSQNWVLVGGPPCQAYSNAGKGRNRSKKDYVPEKDERHFLYAEYMRIISKYWPAVVIMENVQGILSSRVGGNRIFGRILGDLADPGKLFKDRRRPNGGGRYRIYPLAEKHGDPDLFGYTADRPMDYLVKSERFGIPQRRHRVVLFAVRDDLKVEPELLEAFSHGEISVKNTLAGLPRLRSGLSEGDDSDQSWIDVLKESPRQPWFKQIDRAEGGCVRDRILETLENLLKPKSGRGGVFVRKKLGQTGKNIPDHLRDWLIDERLDGFCNHETRRHMRSDLHRYLFCSSFASEYGRSAKLSDFPAELLPAHDSVGAALSHGNFSDRFRVQLAHEPATTITSHIARDGHYYIHPDPLQCRSLTVREAARLQTFPDNYFFCGSRGQQYTQVGNAVPPLLAKQIAGIVAKVLDR